MVSFERLFEVLDLVPMIKESPDAVVMPDGAAELIFNHVDFSYPGAEEVSLASLEAVARLERHAAHRRAPRRLVPRRTGHDDRVWSVTAVRARRRFRCWCRVSMT